MNDYIDFFNELNSSNNIDEISKLFKKYDIKRKDSQLYPNIEFNITVVEIDELKRKGIITEENYFSLDINKNNDLTALEKLLYSIIWKQRDLKKERHIISGIYGINTDRKVFNQFGKHLNNKDEPIIDQHVIRSFILYKTGEIIKDIKDKHYDLYSDQYIKWLNDNNFFRNNKTLIDELMFCLGKKIK